MSLLHWLTAICLLIGPWLAPASADAFNAPAYSSNVVDETGTLSQAEVQKLLETIETLRQAHIWAAVAIFKSVNGDSIEQAANDTFTKWALGQKGQDNGLLLIVSLDDHLMRIEVGRGLEATITDLASHRVVDEILQPYFRRNEFATGLTEALLKLRLIHLKQLDPNDIQPISPFNWVWAILGFVFNFSGLILFLIYFYAKKASGTRLRLRQLPSDISFAVIVISLVGLFMSAFWGLGASQPTFLYVFPWFNAVFVIACSVPTLWGPFKFLRSEGLIRLSNLEWDEADTAKVKYQAGLKAAELAGPGQAEQYIFETRVPVYPGKRIRLSPKERIEEKEVWNRARRIAGFKRFFGQLCADGSVIYFWQGGGGGGGGGSSGGSPGSSSGRSSGSSGSSSSGGGSSAGGGASGSW